ncbi:hypothetical protein Barb4_01859 [Bacteroidales bacterium Barb4]|nr:hypothetical protein Barb4_01859 [Bacteroidales bacterium Barb4]
MRREDKAFRMFRESFNNAEGRFHLLEHRVPVEIQKEYFTYSERMRRSKSFAPLSDAQTEVLYAQLQTGEASVAEKKYMLTSLAVSCSVKAFRMLEEYAGQSEPDVADWACLALAELRIALETELSGEKQMFISTGLGGKDGKMRFYVLFLAEKNVPFKDYQRRVIEQEFPYMLAQAGCETESLTVGSQYVELLSLIPFRTDIKSLLEGLIAECNQYGNFLSYRFTINNIKELTQEEINEAVRENGDD